MPEVVIGEYTVDTNNEFGKGKCSTVYVGRHANGQKVAVKKVDWTAISKTKHDNIVKKLQQALSAQKARKEYEHALLLLDFQVCSPHISSCVFHLTLVIFLILKFIIPVFLFILPCR